MVAYSALASSESVSSSEQAPVDVVLIIDISGSMSNGSSNMDNGKSRIYNTIVATNNAIDAILALDEYSRVAVVAFSGNTQVSNNSNIPDAQILLPLDRYTKTKDNQNKEVDYFTLSRESGNSNYAQLYTKAINSKNTKIDKTTHVSGGTNIQMGLYTGMNILASEKNTTVTINDKVVKRVPSVIVLSDGAPTYSSDSTSWWAPSDNHNDGPGSGSYAGNGMKAIMTGAYMKAAIDRNYNVANSQYRTTVYSIGMGITSLSGSDKNLAYMTLDPGTYWNNGQTNTMKTAIKGYWQNYTANENTGTATISVNSNDTYTLTHPNTGYDVDPLKGYDYVDDYYDANNASTVTNVFNEIVSNIAISAPKVPTEIKGDDPMSDGYITYTDPIGDYMEVKDIKAIIYAGQTFTNKSVTKEGYITTYTFEGVVESPVYGHQELKNIIITVEDFFGYGEEIVEIKVPASVIPLRVNEIVLNEDGSVKTHTNNGAMPIRVVYSVGLQSKVTKQDAHGKVYIDKSKLSKDYLKDNTNADGTINFYSNAYGDSHTINGSTVGDATVVFEPAHENSFYYILENMPIYKDHDLTQQVTSDEGLGDSTTYYYRLEYYHGNEKVLKAVERTGEQLKQTEIITGDDGYLYRAKGSPRLNRILLFEGTKLYNRTNTAEDFYAPEFDWDGIEKDPKDGYDGCFVIYLGNNGLLTMVAGGDLQISKEVTSDDGLTAPDKTYEFTIELNNGVDNHGEFSYVIVDEDGNNVSEGTLTKLNNKVYLKDGEVATIYGLPADVTYEVVETSVDGFTTTSEGESGIIEAGETSYAYFTNTYKVNPVTWPTSDELKVTKVLDGREWDENDEFNFLLIPYNNAPLPANYDSDKGVVVKGSQVSGSEVSFNFGTIEFTKPGTFRYIIVEDEPENDAYLPGMTYSRAVYRVVVNVVDNGDGTLSVSDSEVQRLYNDLGEQLFTYDDNNQIVMNPGQGSEDEIIFTNKYAVGPVIRVPVAFKEYKDNSGQKPLVSGMFDFELKAIGIVENNVVVDTDISKVPMPSGSINGTCITTNEGRTITFPGVEFTQDLVPDGSDSITYRYQMSEVIPTNKVNGMTYDETVYTIDVVVELDPTSDVLKVSAIYPNDERVVTFHNEYTPNSVSTSINGLKTLVGRDMKANEKFEFNLTPNTATTQAINDGLVVVPSYKAYVMNGKDSQAQGFSFANITFKKAGTYVFRVNETKGDEASVTYDDSVVRVSIVVDDTNDDGNLEIVSITYNNGKNAAEFTNTYTSTYKGDGVSLIGSKNLTGKTLLEGEFFFDVTLFHNDVYMGSRLVSHSGDASGNDGVYTGTIDIIKDAKYVEPGKYEYRISEVIPHNPVGGTTYDNSNFRYTVIVEDDLEGNLVVTSTTLEKSVDGTWTTADYVVFNNTYKTENVKVTMPLINKLIDGQRVDGLKEGEFSFTISVLSAQSSDGVILPSVTTVANKANGNIVFDEITFTKAGTYYIAVQEVVPADEDKVPGITYSTQNIVAEYTVVDNRNGHLTATLTGLHGGNNITNIYRAQAAEATIEITKDFSGRVNDEWLASDKFDFEVKVDDEATLTAIENEDIVFTFDDEVNHSTTYTITDKDDKASVNITVNKPGTYKFKVSEINGGIAGVTYDTNVKEVTIIATDDSANAKIVVDVNNTSTNKATLNFTNTYQSSASDPLSLSATKVVSASDGNSYTLVGGEFSFVIEGVDNVPMPTNTTVTNDADGKVVFGNIEFNERGTYYYTIREVQGELGGMSYDGSVYNVKVVVKDDYATAKLVVETTITNQDGEDVEIIFNNTYNPDETNVVIFGNKELRSEHKDLVKDEFEFTIRALTPNAPIPSDYKATNSATGSFQFAAITFNQVGIYKYEVKETNLGKDGYTYDDKVYIVTITVTDDNGQLKASVDGLGTIDEATIKFVNEYKPSTTQATIEANKVLVGRDLVADEFTFNLYDKNNELVATATNDASGKVTFTLDFDKAGKHKYTIKETNNGLVGITYDETVYDVVVDVNDHEGHLKVDAINYLRDGVVYSNVQFENNYKPTSTELIINGTKQLSGRELKGEEFSFELKDSDGNLISAATNDADGSFNFARMVYSEVGTYNYTVSETNNGLAGVTYDEKVYNVKVVVEDQGGYLEVTSIVYTLADGRVNDVVFNNSYKASDTELVIKANKQLEGRELVAEEFNFVIKDNEGKVVASATNKANGQVEFSKIVYTKVGTYNYTISETNDNLAGITYDETVYNVSVVVEDKGGYLEVTSVTYEVANDEVENIVFNNTYKPAPVDFVISGVKHLEGRDLKANEFEFVLKDDAEQLVAKVSNDADGKFSFEAITYEEAGTYYYTISETNNALGGVTYDEKVYNVEVVVADNSGKLEIVKVTYTSDDVSSEDVIFNNIYKAKDVEIEISAIKNLTGRELKEGEFTFVIKNSNDEIISKTTNTKDGKVVFDKINFTEAGTYTFVVSEESGNDKDVTYDKTQYLVTVEVVDNENGDLVVKSVVITKVDNEEVVNDIIFVNTYTEVEKPKEDTPKTGDTTNMGLWVVMLAVSALGLLITSYQERKDYARK